MRMRSIAACAAALAASVSASYGGPCWDDISAVQASIDAVLETKAADQAILRQVLDKPWREPVQPTTLASRLWPTCGALFVISLRATLMTSDRLDRADEGLHTPESRLIDECI